MIFIDDKGLLHSLDFTDLRKNLINRTKPFNLFKQETYINVNWDILKYCLILSIAYLLLSPNSIMNTDELNLVSYSNPTNENFEINSVPQENQVSEAATQKNKILKDISKAGKIFLTHIKALIAKNNLEQNAILRSKIIEMIDNAEKSFIYITFIPSELLEEIESIKSKLFFEKKLEEKNILPEEDLTRDFDEVSRISYTYSYISESTTNQSDSEDFLFQFEKKKGNDFLKNAVIIKKK